MKYSRRLAALVVAAVLAPVAARSAESVAVVGAGTCGDPTLRAHVEAVRQALGRKLGAVVQSEERTVQPLGGLPRGSLASATRLLGEAEADFLSSAAVSRAESAARDKRAEEKLQQARDVLASIVPSKERWNLFLRIQALELRMNTAPGQRAGLERALESIYRVARDFNFDPMIYSPPQIEMFEQVHERIRRSSTAILTLTSQPPGLVFYLDGFEVGPGPVTLKVPPGTYRVETATGPRRGIARTVKVMDRMEVAIDTDVEKAIQLDSGPCVESATNAVTRKAAFARLASLVGVQTIVAVRAEQSSSDNYLAVESFDVSGARRGGAAIKLVGGKASQEGLAGLWEMLSGKQQPNLAISSSKSPFLVSLPARSPPPPRWLRPAAFVAGGLAVGFGGVAIVEGVSSRSSYRKADAYVPRLDTLTPAERTSYEKALNDGASAKKGMYISIGVAAVFAGAAGVLGYMSLDPSPPVIRF